MASIRLKWAAFALAAWISFSAGAVVTSSDPWPAASLTLETSPLTLDGLGAWRWPESSFASLDIAELQEQPDDRLSLRLIHGQLFLEPRPDEARPAELWREAALFGPMWQREPFGRGYRLPIPEADGRVAITGKLTAPAPSAGMSGDRSWVGGDDPWERWQPRPVGQRWRRGYDEQMEIGARAASVGLTITLNGPSKH